VQLGVDFVGFETDTDYWAQAEIAVDKALEARDKAS
jgi:hypothetical protein